MQFVVENGRFALRTGRFLVSRARLWHSLP